MRFVIQRVTQAKVEIEGSVSGQIQKGLLVLVGIGEEDTPQIADKLLKKLIGLRIFEDEQGKTNLTLADVGGSLLLVSQFTLYADCKRGNRPGFSYAAKPDKAKALYEYILTEARKTVPLVEQGQFGADMKVTLTNDGPFTILLDSDQL